MIDPRPLWDFDDPAASAERFLDAAEGSSEPDRTAWLSQYVRALGLQEKYDEATKVLDRLPSTDPATEVWLGLERGRLLRSAGRPEDARPWFQLAADAAEAEALDALQIDSLHMLALASPTEEQPAIHDRALAIARASDDPQARDWDASLLNNVGMTHADAGDFGAALDAFQEALAARERIGDPARTRVARWMVGWALRNLGRRQEALTVQLGLKDELDSIGDQDAYVDEELLLLAD